MSAPDRITVFNDKRGKGWSAQGVSNLKDTFAQDYVRADLADRSQKSHNHEFAEINELFENLPYRLEHMPYAASADALRKHALIKKNWCDVVVVDFATEEAMKTQGADLKRKLLKDHGYIIATRSGTAVTYLTPHSQTMKAMGKTKFQESKTDVLDWIKQEFGIET